MGVTVNALGTGVATVVITVHAADIQPPLVFNLALQNGIATGTIRVPPGASRTVSALAFESDGAIAYEGSVLLPLVERGRNPPVSIPMVPRSGQVPITVQIGPVSMVVSPATAYLSPGQTLQLTATITAAGGKAVTGPAEWATANPTVAMVDANGLVTALSVGTVEIVATYAGVGGIATLLVGAPPSAAFAPTLSPRFPIASASPAPLPWSDGPRSIATASDGSGFLAVWTEQRPGALLVLAARISRGGELLDPIGLPLYTVSNVSGPSSPVGTVVVGFGAGEYLAIWELVDGSLRGARVTTAGEVRDPDGFPVAPAGPSRRALSMASAADRHLVVWDVDAGIEAVRVSSTGELLDPAPFLLEAGPASIGPLAAASDGSRFLVAWSRAGAPVARRYDLSGAPLDPAPITVGSAGDHVAVAYGAATYLVVWRGETATQAARVSGEGRLLDPAPVTVSSQRPATGLGVAFSGQVFLVSYDAWSALVDPGGVVVARDLLQDRADALCANADGFMLARVDSIGGYAYRRVGQDGTWLDPSTRHVPTPAAYQILPAVASSATQHLVVWSEYRGSAPGVPPGWYVRAARVTPEGLVLDPAGFDVLGPTPPLSWRSPARVASDGVDFLVVANTPMWSPASPEVRAVRVSATGAVLGPERVVARPVYGAESAHPVVAWSGEAYLVAWVQNAGPDPYGEYEVYAARLARDGTVLDPQGFAVARSGTGVWSPPAVNGLGGQFLVAWPAREGAGPVRIRASRVTRDGVVLDPGGFLVSDDRSAYDDHVQIAVADPARGASAPLFLVAWADTPGMDFTQGVSAARVSTTGLVLDPVSLDLTPGLPRRGSFPTVATAHDGARFVVAWADAYSVPGVHLVGVTAAGGVLDGGVSGDWTSPSRVGTCGLALASAGAGRSLLLDCAFDRSPLVTAYRAQGRWIDAPVQ
jgi:hypothetical protein